MNDFKLMSSPVFWAAMAIIVFMHLLTAFFKAYSGRDSKVIFAANIIAHLTLCFYMLYNRADAMELLLALLISLAANLASRKIKKGGKKDGI